MPRPLLCWACLTVVACGESPRVGQQAAQVASAELDLTGQDPELVRALGEAQARVRAAPRDPATNFELAAVLDANELDGPAEAAWVRATELDPANAKTWYHLARVRERRGDWERAIEAVQGVLTRASDYAPAYTRLGRLFLETGRLDEAERALQRALELEPGAPAASLALARLELLRARPAAAIERLEPLRARLPQEPYVNGLLARAFAMQGDEQRAAQSLRAEEEAGAPSVRDPWQAEVQRRACGLRVRLERVKARLANGDPAGAWKELEPLEARAGELAVLDAQCQVLLALARPEEALARIARAAPELRASSLLAVKRVLALRALGQDQLALDEIEAEVRRNPAHPNGHALRGELLFDCARYPEAVEALEAARARNDRSLATALLLGRARAAKGDLVGALGELDGAARDFPNAPKPWAYRCEVLALDGRKDEACASLEEAKRRGLEPELVERVAARLAELEAEEAQR